MEHWKDLKREVKSGCYCPYCVGARELNRSKEAASCASHVEARKSSPASGGVSSKDGAQRSQHEYVRQHNLSILCFMLSCDSSFYSRASQRRHTQDRASCKHFEHCGHPNQGSGEGVVPETPSQPNGATRANQELSVSKCGKGTRMVRRLRKLVRRSINAIARCTRLRGSVGSFTVRGQANV